ncbi:MAG: hypothetical protein ACREFX_15460 [Opitutaceae bacterium]
MRKLLILSALVLCATVRAQSVDGVPGVAIKLWGAADTSISDSGSLSVSVDGLNGTATSAGSGGAAFTSDPTILKILPGVTYNISIGMYWNSNESSATSHVYLGAVAPPGYQIYINGTAQTSDTIFTSGMDDYIDNSTTLLVLGPGQFTGRAGACTSLISGQIYWQIAMGNNCWGTSAGSVVLADQGLETNWSDVFTPADLHYMPLSAGTPDGTTFNEDSNGNLQSITGGAADVAVTVLSPTSYTISFYTPAQYPTGKPYVVYTVAQGSSATQLQITSETYADPDFSTPARSAVTTLTRTGDGSDTPYVWTLVDWHDSGQSVVRQETRTWGTSLSGASTETRVVSAGGSSPAATTVTKTFGEYAWGEELTQLIQGSGSDAITTNYQNYTNPAQVGTYGFQSQDATVGGAWTAVDYHDWDDSEFSPIGTVYHVYRPFCSSPSTLTQSPSAGAVTTYQWADDDFGMPTRPQSVITAINNTTVTETTYTYKETQMVDPLLTAPDAPPGTTTDFTYVTASRKDYSGSSSSLVTTTKYFSENTPDTMYAMEPFEVIQPDGVMQYIAYERGSFSTPGDPSTFVPWYGENSWMPAAMFDITTTVTGPDTRTYEITGSNNSAVGTQSSNLPDGGSMIDPVCLVNNKSTMTVTIRDYTGNIVRTESWAYVNGAWANVGWVNYTYDGAGFLVDRVASNGASHTWTYNGEELAQETDESGTLPSHRIS